MKWKTLVHVFHRECYESPALDREMEMLHRRSGRIDNLQRSGSDNSTRDMNKKLKCFVYRREFYEFPTIDRKTEILHNQSGREDSLWKCGKDDYNGNKGEKVLEYHREFNELPKLHRWMEMLHIWLGRKESPQSRENDDCMGGINEQLKYWCLSSVWQRMTVAPLKSLHLSYSITRAPSNANNDGHYCLSFGQLGD